MTIEKEIIEHYGAQTETIVAMEEMAELIKELSKSLRGQTDRNAIIEEMADVLICLAEQRIIHDISLNDVLIVMTEKLERMKERIDHDHLQSD